MKVIQILPELNAGGVERGTLEIAAALVADGHESVVISNGGRLVQELEAAGSRHITLPVHRKSLATLGQIKPLRRLLEKEQPDIVHVRSRVPAWITWLAWRGMNRTTRPRFVSTVHGFYSINFYSAIMTRGERVIAVSNSIQDYILKNYPKTPNDRIRLIFRGIELEKYGADFQADESWLKQWQSEQPQLEGKSVLLLPGRITRLKGHDDFFRLIASLHQQGIPVHGMIVGDTHANKHAYLDELKTIVKELNIENHITFLGHRRDIREVMSVSNVVCALSQQPESFGRTVLEALALGKPVVGYDCGGVGELLAELFPAGRVPLSDSNSLLETTQKVLLNNARPKEVGEPFTLEAMCQNTLEVYKELAR
jgi:glycosyltransferase involved in cell wall biosynthesis